MKTTIFITAFLLMLLFTGTKTYDYRYEKIAIREREIDNCVQAFRSEYDKGLMLERRVDSMAVIVKQKENEIKLLNAKIKL